MEKYLQKLIKEHNRVIVPDFGAFIVSQGKELSIIFNGFLSFNDGLLIGHISNEEGIDTTAATEKVEEFVEHIKDSLERTGSFHIEELGTFLKDISGSLQFKQENREPFATEQIFDDIALESDDLLDISSTDDVSAIVIDEQVHATSFQSTDPLLTIETTNSQNISNININITSNTEMHTENHDEPQFEEEQKKTQKPFPIWLPILILILLAMGFICYFLFFGNNTFKFFKKKNIAIEQVETPAPIIETPIVETPVQEVPVVQKPVVSGSQHHIILGSFADEAKANQLVTNLQEKGHNQASVFERNSRFLVSVECHSSVGKALERQEKLLDELKMESWVLSLR